MLDKIAENKKTDRTITLSAFDNQIFLVAKGHYDKRSKELAYNSIDMLQLIFAKMCAVDNVSEFSIFESVVDVFNQYVPHHLRTDALIRCFRFGADFKETISYKNMTLWMLGAISSIKIVKNGELLFDMNDEIIEV
jgi:hypothetical protein